MFNNLINFTRALLIGTHRGRPPVQVGHAGVLLLLHRTQSKPVLQTNEPVSQPARTNNIICTRWKEGSTAAGTEV